MNKSLLLTARIITTMLVAAIVGAVVTILIAFILLNLGVDNETSLGTSTAAFYLIVGIATGYRLNDLMKQYRKR